PEDEVRVEATGLEEANALAAALVAEQIDFAAAEGSHVVLEELGEVLDEVALAAVEGDRSDFDDLACEVDEWHVEVPVECQRLQRALREPGHASAGNGVL